MEHNSKKLLYFILAFVIVVGMLPQMSLLAHADDYSGTCGADGDNLKWYLDPFGGRLTIYGSGKMADYDDSSAPWYSYKGYITKVELPEGLLNIGANAFRASGLKEVTIPNSVKNINENAFQNCGNLEKVIIGDGVTTIGQAAFDFCWNLKSVQIGNGVTSIGHSAFATCVSLTSVKIPDTVVSIGADAFANCQALETVKLSDNLTNINPSTFIYCYSLKSITIPNSVKSIGQCAFMECTSLKNVAIGNSVEKIDAYAFDACKSLTNVSIPDSVKYIGVSAFYGCESLTSAVVGNGVTSIKYGVFSYCTDLISVTIPTNVAEINYYSFEACNSLTTVYGYIGSFAQDYAEKHSLTFVSLDNAVGGFLDVTPNDWFATPVLWAVNNSITGGTDEHHFSPFNTVMRADTMVFFWAAKGRPEFTATDKTFKDVKKKHWAYKAVMWAVENGITGGTDTEGLYFSPQRICMRSEVLQFLYAAMGKPEHTIENPYSDVKDKHWYKDGAIWAYEKGLEKGEGGKFNAKTPCTRAYVATYLYRYFTGNELANETIRGRNNQGTVL